MGMRLLVFILFVLCSPLLSVAQSWPEYKSFQASSFEEGDLLLIPTIMFTHSCNRIDDRHLDSVKVIANLLQKHPGMIIQIGVHTDARGSEAANQVLSEFRGRAVKSYLVEKYRIDEARIIYVGFGESVPIVAIDQIHSERSKEEQERLHAINRRMEITVLQP